MSPHYNSFVKVLHMPRCARQFASIRLGVKTPILPYVNNLRKKTSQVVWSVLSFHRLVNKPLMIGQWRFPSLGGRPMRFMSRLFAQSKRAASRASGTLPSGSGQPRLPRLQLSLGGAAALRAGAWHLRLQPRLGGAGQTFGGQLWTRYEGVGWK